MRVFIVTQYFWPENFRINDLALGLLERGHQVTVLTGSPNYPLGSFFEGYGYFNKPEDYHGVKILRVPLISRGNGSGARLAINYLSFVVSACLMGPFLCREKYDLILVFQMSPVTQGLPALLLKRLYKLPIFFWVQDLWPESLSATGAIRSEPILRLVGKMVSFIYRRCDKILIQSRSFLDSIMQLGGDPDRIHYFPNSAEDIFTKPSCDTSDLPALPTGFRVMFAGNIGAAQDFQTILAAAEKLQQDTEIKWIMIGDGRMRQWAEAEAEKRGLANVHFFGRFPLETMPSFFTQADAMLVTLKKEPIFALTIPSKVQSYLACSKPVIAALDGEGARVIDSSGAGFTCSAESPDDLAQAVLRMYRISLEEREEMGKQGRAYYNENFEREMLLDRLEQWMTELAAERGRGQK